MGKTVLDWSLDAFKNHPIRRRHAPSAKHLLEKDWRHSAPSTLTLLIHDAARPLIAEKLITSICNAAEESGAAIPTLPITDAVKRHGKTENRNGLYTVQTPQAFHFKTIDGLHEKYKDLSLPDDAALFEQEKLPVVTVTGDATNIKVTHPDDMLQAENIFCRAIWMSALGTDMRCIVLCHRIERR